MQDVFAQLLSPGNLLMNMVGGVVLTAFCFWLISRVLPPRSVKAYWTISLSVIVVMMFLKPLRDPVVGSIIYGAVSILLPIVLLKGSLFARVLTSLMYMVAMTIGEVAGVSAWYAATGLGVVDNDIVLANFPAYIFGMWGINMTVTGLLMMGVRYLIHRFVPCGLSEDEAVKVEGTWSTAYIIFIIMQFTVIFEAATYGFVVQAWSPESLLLVSVLLVVFALVDVLLFQIMGRTITWAREQSRAEALEGSIAAYLREAQEMQALLDGTAKLRHDIRNHRSVVEVLCERGDFEQAKTYLQEL